MRPYKLMLPPRAAMAGADALQPSKRWRLFEVHHTAAFQGDRSAVWLRLRASGLGCRC